MERGLGWGEGIRRQDGDKPVRHRLHIPMDLQTFRSPMLLQERHDTHQISLDERLRDHVSQLGTSCYAPAPSLPPSLSDLLHPTY
ncbi:hypothetical protein E2C01_075711 [Portunus trituberculatus]|uniref:Uncharacterized protein n=1 Tax=Portunus trituberculatus TaxID=210409 RepID=A0A5B7I9A7_PORTR|nr:hypothetical protein [Portunus trituberculatus]